MARHRSTIAAGVLLIVASQAIAQVPGQNDQWNVIASSTLVPTGEPARVDNPDCANGVPTTAEMVMPLLNGAIDEYIGYPIMGTIAKVSPQAEIWLQERLGLNDGKSVCAALCGIAPRTAPVKVCEEDEQFKRACFAAGDTGEGPQPFSFTGPMSQRARGTAKVVCVNVKHWSDGLERSFTLEADY